MMEQQSTQILCEQVLVGVNIPVKTFGTSKDLRLWSKKKLVLRIIRWSYVDAKLYYHRLVIVRRCNVMLRDVELSLKIE